MSKPQKRCIFCGATGMSREHIWGDWLKKYLTATMTKHTSSVHVVNPPGVRDVRSFQIRAGDPLGSKVRVVCTTCNNTWLSGIQDAAKPLLIPMLIGQTSVLGDVAQKTKGMALEKRNAFPRLAYLDRPIPAAPTGRAMDPLLSADLRARTRDCPKRPPSV